MRKIFLALIIMSILISPVIGDDNSTKEPVTYRVSVDNQQGFSRVYDVTSNKVVYAQNKTLNIYRGDTIVWSNNVDARITIISEQGLWDNKSGFLPREYKIFNYTFTKSGIYDIYIKEAPSRRQKIIVGPIEPELIPENVINMTTNIEEMESGSTDTTVVIQNYVPNTPSVTTTSTKTIYRGYNFDTVILLVLLLSIFVLSGRIKE